MNHKTKKKSSLISNIIYGILLVSQIVLLILCYGIYFNKFIKPSVFPYFGLLALIFPISFLLYLLNLIFSYFYNIKRSSIFLVLAIPLGISFSNIYKIRFSNYPKKGIKLMTYNVRYGNGGLDDIQKYIQKKEPEIVFLQEIYKRHWRSDAFLADHYNAVHDYVGISSKFPIIYNTKITLHDSNGYACMADIKIGEDTIRAFSVYLGSIYLTKVLKDITQNQDIENNTTRAKSKLLQGYRNHEKQLAILKKYIDESPYPVLIGGDFNSVPNSYEYYAMEEKLDDAFDKHSGGLATTFHDYKYPIRIDYFFGSDQFVFNHYEVDRSINLSDHFPVFCNMQLPKKEVVKALEE